MKHKNETFPRVSRTATARAALALALGLSGTAFAGPTISAGDESYLTISYALQVWGEARSYTSPNDSGRTWDSYLRRNRLTFSGQYNDYVGFYAQLEAGNDSKDGVDNKGTYYRDAYVTLDYSDELRFLVGRFKNGFSRENNEACLEPLTLDRSEASYTPFGGTRDTGVAVWGNLADARFQYRVAIGDGREGDNVAKKNPRLTARVHWSPLDPESDYGYRGTYLGTRKIFTVGAAVDQQSGVAYGDFAQRKDIKDYSAWTVDVFGELPTASGTYTASAAYFNYDTGGAINQSPDPKLPANTELKASYVKAGYLLPNKVGPGRLQFFGRHDRAEYGLNSGALDYSANALGANYYLDGQRLKLTFEYARTDYDKEVATNPAQQDNWRSTVGLQFIF